MASITSEDDDTYTNDNIAELTRKYRESANTPNVTCENGESYEEIVAKNRSFESTLSRSNSFVNLDSDHSFTKRSSRRTSRANISRENSFTSLSRENSFANLTGSFAHSKSYSNLSRENSFSNLSYSHSYTNLSRENSYTNIARKSSTTNRARKSSQASPTSRENRSRKSSQASPTLRENRSRKSSQVSPTSRSRRSSRIAYEFSTDETTSSDESYVDVTQGDLYSHVTCLEAHISPKEHDDGNGDIVKRLAAMKSKLQLKINSALGKASQQVTEVDEQKQNKRHSIVEMTKKKLDLTENMLAFKYEEKDLTWENVENRRKSDGRRPSDGWMGRVEPVALDIATPRRQKLSTTSGKSTTSKASKYTNKFNKWDNNNGTESSYGSTITLESVDFDDMNMAWSKRYHIGDTKSDDNRDSYKTPMSMETFRRKQDVLLDMLNEDANVDVAFVVDCTRSMDKYIRETKNDIQHIVTDIITRFANKVRVAFVGYRDHGNGLSRIEYIGFTESIDLFKDFVSKIRATGGGDPPEDVFGGLEVAINLSWASANKIIFHIGDAPQHGHRYHDYSQTLDDFYHTEPRGLRAEDLLEAIQRKNIKYYFGKINNSTDKMIAEFRSIAGNDIVEVTDIKEPRFLGNAVIKSVTKSIDFALSRSIYGLKSVRQANKLNKANNYISENSLKLFTTDKSSDFIHYFTGSSERGGKMWSKKLKPFNIVDVEPDYASMRLERNVKWLECEMPPVVTADSIQRHMAQIHHRWRTATIKRAANPFSEGEQRISYHGSKISSYSNENIVLKEFKHDGRGMDRREDYIEIMETQAIAAFMAKQFNKISPKGSKEVHFLHVSVVQVPQDDGSPKYYNVEKLLPDYSENFTKWNNNAGYVSELNCSATLDAFSHWTYDITGGFFVIVDLQGVTKDGKYVLTDPSINCVEPRFGRTNLGDIGIRMFFMSHVCGDVCRAMKLKKNKFMPTSSPPPRFSTNYTKVYD